MPPAATRPPANCDKYVVKPLNLNTRVNETDQVDTLNVFNGDSPADDTGILTGHAALRPRHGHRPDARRPDVPGGIHYGNLEVLNIELGSGNDTLHRRVDARRPHRDHDRRTATTSCA